MLKLGYALSYMKDGQDRSKIAAVWEKFKSKIDSLRQRQRLILEVFSKRADEEKLKNIRKLLK